MWKRIDLLLRFLYVLIAPAFLVAFASIIPMTGVLVGVGIATIVALVGSDRWRAGTQRIRFVGGFLSKLANLGDYYREHPPKPLIYYVLYPVLFPYWLFVKKARREFLLYRRLNSIALVAIPLFGTYEYMTKWRPEIPFAMFLQQTIVIFVLQLLVVFALVMPIVTTIVVFHTNKMRKTLAVVLVLALLSAVGIGIAIKRKGEPDHFTAIRMTYRAQSNIVLAEKLLAAAVIAADRSFKAAPTDQDAARGAAHTELVKLWRSDEASLFKLFRASDGTTALYINFRQKPTIWLARLPTGRFTFHPAEIPADLRAKLKRPLVPPTPARPQAPKR